jgi:general stress protein 26
MSSHTATDSDVAKLGKLIKGIKVAMLTTICPDGSLRSRPMVTQEAEFDGTLWFFTRADMPMADEVQRSKQVNVTYVSPDDQRYVSVSGTAHVARDTDKSKELWHPLLKAWFPQGPDDPQVALLRIDVEKAEYWDAPSSTWVHLAGFAKALATGQPSSPGERA